MGLGIGRAAEGGAAAARRQRLLMRAAIRAVLAAALVGGAGQSLRAEPLLRPLPRPATLQTRAPMELATELAPEPAPEHAPELVTEPATEAEVVRQSARPGIAPEVPDLVSPAIPDLARPEVSALAPQTSPRPRARPWAGARLPKLAWDGRSGAAVWSLAVMQAIERHPRAFSGKIPSDISAFCPGYPQRSGADRAAFWAGLLSVIARHESRFDPQAAGGGGRYLGLMQISAATARHHGCALPEAGLRDGAANLSCAVTILAGQVRRDGQVAGKAGAWRGAARDWYVLRDAKGRAQIAAWTKKQPYCQ